jgi:hypothetical protein
MGLSTLDGNIDLAVGLGVGIGLACLATEEA